MTTLKQLASKEQPTPKRLYEVWGSFTGRKPFPPTPATVCCGVTLRVAKGKLRKNKVDARCHCSIPGVHT